jgi:hypothetical protein
MVSSRDRISQCRDDPEGSSQDHRRLRFSFQINDVKDPNRLAGPTVLTPGSGGGGYLVAPVFRVNRPFSGFLRSPAGAEI